MENKGQNEKRLCEVGPEDIQSLLEYFSRNTYKAKDSHPMVQQVMQKCLALFRLDYNYTVIPNNQGELSTNYPSTLIILESEKDSSNNNMNGSGDGGISHGNGNGVNLSEDEVETGAPSEGVDLLLESESFIGTSLPHYHSSIHFPSANGNGHNNHSYPTSNSNNNIKPDSEEEVSKLKELCSRARFARCRARFPVSVILYNKTHICRSATLSGGPEIYGRSSFDYFFSGGADYKSWNDMDAAADDEIVVPETQSDWQLFDRVRSQDIRLLKSFQVHTIVDLMVEKKKVKFGVNVTSSEKVDKENRYAEFNLVSLPYPGCEFFKDYRDNSYNAKDLIFDWNQSHVDASICVPDDIITLSLNTDWSQYRMWDLATLTQKYLKLLLGYIGKGRSGLLVHCISGWDRTPLFISLLRLSLWADGVIHKSLSVDQILYLTLAYDWLLFGHNLEDRLSKGEEIMFFCFYFLKYIVDPEFSVVRRPVETSLPSATDKKQKPIRVRNDSDIQLDGVLLEADGGSQTSPDGSNWSLNSISSSQSNRSLDNPPTYFQVSQESSWEDYRGAHHLLSRQRHSSSSSSNSNQFAQVHNLTGSNRIGNGASISSTLEPAVIKEEVIVEETGSIPIHQNSSVGVRDRTNGVHSNGVNVLGGNKCASFTSLKESPSISLPVGTNSSLPLQDDCQFSSVLKSVERTNPVAVPSRIHRPDSTSSASIGSWQLITDPGSLRDAISSNALSSHGSHPNITSKLPMNGSAGQSTLDAADTAESSCTLVDELIPKDMTDSMTSMSDSVVTIPASGIELSLEKIKIDDPLQAAQEMTESGWKHIDHEEAEGLEDSIFAASLTNSTCAGLEGTPTNVTPTKEQEDLLSSRKERLQGVRAQFYTYYASAIGFNRMRNVNDNGSGGGLGFLIGNLLGTAKGGRVINRTTNV